MPPIRKGDGTPVTPKGISQVRTGDGRILFDGVAIPDSALLHFPFRERSDSTLVEEIGGYDGTANGLTNVSGNWWDGYAEDGDGVDAYGDLGDWTEVNFGERLVGEWGLAFTLETTDDGVEALGTDRSSEENATWLFVMRIGSGSVPSNKIGLSLEDKENNGNRQVIASSSDVNDGGKYRIMVGGDGSSANNKVMFVNGTDETNIEQDEGDHSSNANSNFDQSIYSHALNNANGDAINNLDGVIDNVIPLDSKPTDTVAQNDYNSQPWS